jgi:hypothetical protein
VRFPARRSPWWPLACAFAATLALELALGERKYGLFGGGFGASHVIDRPAEIGRSYPRPLVAVRGPDVLGLLAALRRFPHAAAVWPFGETLHYTDTRADIEADRVAVELAAHLKAEGFTDVTTAAIPAGIEDAFMWYMAEERAA